MSQCRVCPAEIIWCKMLPSGARNPLDTERADSRGEIVGKNLVAFNPETGNGIMVTAANADDVRRWVGGGVTLHLSHWATCPARDHVRKHGAKT
jgi:hypothetical protein